MASQEFSTLDSPRKPGALDPGRPSGVRYTWTAPNRHYLVRNKLLPVQPAAAHLVKSLPFLPCDIISLVCSLLKGSSRKAVRSTCRSWRAAVRPSTTAVQLLGQYSDEDGSPGGTTEEVGRVLEEPAAQNVMSDVPAACDSACGPEAVQYMVSEFPAITEALIAARHERHACSVEADAHHDAQHSQHVPQELLAFGSALKSVTSHLADEASLSILARLPLHTLSVIDVLEVERTSNPANTIPPSLRLNLMPFCGLSTLQKLSVAFPTRTANSDSWRSIGNLTQLKQLSITTMNIPRNQARVYVEDINQAISTLSQLTTLELNIESVWLSHFLALQSLTSLNSLALCSPSCVLYTTKDPFLHISHCTALTRLSVHFNGCPATSVQPLTQLLDLDIPCLDMRTRESALPAVLQHCSHLTSLRAVALPQQSSSRIVSATLQVLHLSCAKHLLQNAPLLERMFPQLHTLYVNALDKVLPCAHPGNVLRPRRSRQAEAAGMVCVSHEGLTLQHTQLRNLVLPCEVLPYPKIASALKGACSLTSLGVLLYGEDDGFKARVDVGDLPAGEAALDKVKVLHLSAVGAPVCELQGCGAAAGGGHGVDALLEKLLVVLPGISSLHFTRVARNDPFSMLMPREQKDLGGCAGVHAKRAELWCSLMGRVAAGVARDKSSLRVLEVDVDLLTGLFDTTREGWFVPAAVAAAYACGSDDVDVDDNCNSPMSENEVVLFESEHKQKEALTHAASESLSESQYGCSISIAFQSACGSDERARESKHDDAGLIIDGASIDQKSSDTTSQFWQRQKKKLCDWLLTLAACPQLVQVKLCPPVHTFEHPSYTETGTLQQQLLDWVLDEIEAAVQQAAAQQLPLQYHIVLG